MAEHDSQSMLPLPYLRSILVLVALGVLTGLEYWLATTDDLPVFSSALAPLAVIAVIKAGLIVNYYMHISRIWSTEEDAH